MLKDKGTPSFICIPVCASCPAACVLRIYHVFPAHLLSAVHSVVPSLCCPYLGVNQAAFGWDSWLRGFPQEYSVHT